MAGNGDRRNSPPDVDNACDLDYIHCPDTAVNIPGCAMYMPAEQRCGAPVQHAME